ncbi:MAG: GDSL-type esterase/lipase family protein, partial [Schleiferiaceae bacterium]|nr:GDSL-type esterase/lipase family protein [Schleiferiaceae bacterium]
MRTSAFAIAVLLGAASLRAQIAPVGTPELVFPAGDSAFQRVWHRLDTLVYEGRGSLNMIHIGGSHVQAGMLTDAVRRGLHAMSPDLHGSVGWLYPFAVAGTNNPRSYTVTKYGTWTGQRCSVPQHRGPWGFAGIRAFAGDSAGFTMLHKELPLQASSVLLFYPNSDSINPPLVKGPVAEVVRLPDGIEVRFDRPIDTLRVQWQPRKGRRDTLSLEGVLFRPADPNGVRYHSVGVNGAATHSFLKAVRFESQLRELPPDVVVFGLGINDAHKSRGEFDTLAYELRYDSLVDAVRRVNPHAQFIWLTNNDALYKGANNPHGILVQRAMLRLAAKHHGAVFDFFALMGGYGSVRRWMANYWARPDGIHL